ncbi:MAG TPA: hypothetical protein VLV17_05675 [Anaeromyxobacteraceae bacterium]|nr:hypothetical protein [Anaeromyxobacteraceae bacterium]
MKKIAKNAPQVLTEKQLATVSGAGLGSYPTNPIYPSSRVFPNSAIFPNNPVYPNNPVKAAYPNGPVRTA